jgi:hypothetical protein
MANLGMVVGLSSLVFGEHALRRGRPKPVLSVNADLTNFSSLLYWPFPYDVPAFPCAFFVRLLSVESSVRVFPRF